MYGVVQPGTEFTESPAPQRKPRKSIKEHMKKIRRNKRAQTSPENPPHQAGMQVGDELSLEILNQDKVIQINLLNQPSNLPNAQQQFDVEGDLKEKIKKFSLNEFYSQKEETNKPTGDTETEQSTAQSSSSVKLPHRKKSSRSGKPSEENPDSEHLRSIIKDEVGEPESGDDNGKHNGA